MGRKKGSKNKPKEPKYVKSKLETVVQVANEVILAQEKIEQLKQKPVQLVGKSIDIDKVFPSDTKESDAIEKATILEPPFFDVGKITKRLNELVNYESIPFEEIPFPDDWDKNG